MVAQPLSARKFARVLWEGLNDGWLNITTMSAPISTHLIDPSVHFAIQSLVCGNGEEAFLMRARYRLWFSRFNAGAQRRWLAGPYRCTYVWATTRQARKREDKNYPAYQCASGNNRRVFAVVRLVRV